MVVYLSHSLGGETADFLARGNHAANAHDWLRFLVDVTDWSFLVPWQAYVAASIREIQRPRVIRDQLAFLKRCDAVVFVGGEMSKQMEHERQVALEHGIAVIDLTDLGYYPPEVDRIVALIETRRAAAFDLVARNIRYPQLRK